MKLEKMIDCPHTVRCLNKAGIETMEQLSSLTKDDLMRIRGIGQVTSAYVVSVIAKYQSNDTQGGKA